MVTNFNVTMPFIENNNNIMGSTLTKQDLLNDLYQAFNDARKHKNNRPYVKVFIRNLSSNMRQLRDDLWNGTYQPEPSSCFIVNHPKKREVFATHFRDRIVHHLYFNYTHVLFERTFIRDNYSCIKGRGTHDGINRMRSKLQSVSANYTKQCYVLKMDLTGYFMHINRQLILDIATASIDKMRRHESDIKGLMWEDKIDIGFVKKLTKTIALIDPTTDCHFSCDRSEWVGLPQSKSLFHTPEGCGLPIGNLTSQLFSNIYLNKLDQFVTRVLKCKYYGRYVDDFYIISTNKNFLHSIIPKIEEFLSNELRLKINKGKTIISTVQQGVEFLGVYLKPHRDYISNQSLRRIKRRLFDMEYNNSPGRTNIFASVNSFLGIMRHTKSFNVRKNIMDSIMLFKDYGEVNKTYTKFIPYEKL